MTLRKNNYWNSIIQFPIALNHSWWSVQSSYSNIKITSGRYLNKWVIRTCGLWVACLGNASLAICELRAMSLVICELWVTIQPVCELRPGSPGAHSEPSQTSKMELLAKRVNGFQPFTIFAKSSILYFRLVSKHTSGVNNQSVSWESYQSVL